MVTKHNDANVFVIDIGSSNTSWGYAGDDDPRQCRTSAFNWDETNSKWSEQPSQFLELREGVIPMRLMEYKNLPGILQRFNKLNIDDDQSAMSDVDIKPVRESNHLIPHLSKDPTKEHLRYIDNLIPTESLKDKSVLFSEPTKKSSSNSYSRTLGEVSIESMEVEAFFSVRKATLSSFALGRPTALVAETGPIGITISPVFEGYTLKNNIQQYAIGGCLMDWLLATSLQLWDPYRNVFADSFSPFGPKSNRKSSGINLISNGSQKITPMYLHHSRRRILEDMTQSCLVIREGSNPTGPSRGVAAWHGSNRRPVNNESMDNDEDVDQNDFNYNQSADIPYELPDGKAVHIPKSVVTDITEFIFEPWTVEPPHDSTLSNKTTVVSMLSPFESELTPLIRNWPGLARGLVSTAFTCDVDILPSLMSNIVVGGGPSAMEGYLERVASSLSELSHLDVAYKDRCPWATTTTTTGVSSQNMLRDVSQLKVKVAAQSPFDRRFTTWVGGSILASLSSFDRFWITRKEWSEYGPNILYKKLVF